MCGAMPRINKMKSQLNKTELALAMNKSESTITRWIAAGCPCEYTATDSRRIRPMFNLSQVKVWLAKRDNKHTKRNA